MDWNGRSEYEGTGHEPSQDSHPTPLQPLLYARHVWRTASRRVRHWLATRFALDYISQYPDFTDDTEQLVLTGPTRPAKTFEDVLLVLLGRDLGPRAGSLRLRVRYETERLVTAARHRLSRLWGQAAQAGRAVVKAVRDHYLGGKNR